MTPRQRALLLDAAALTLAAWTAWALARHPQLVLPRICGVELVPEVADEPWVCVRPPHPDNEDHQALDCSTWRD